MTIAYLVVAIENLALRKKYRHMKCCLCGFNRGVCGHHIVRKSKIVLDVKQNLIPLCWKCHRSVHDGLKAFRSRMIGLLIFKYGIVKEEKITEAWRRCTDWRPIYERFINGDFEDQRIDCTHLLGHTSDTSPCSNERTIDEHRSVGVAPFIPGGGSSCDR